jgi:2-methylcitrate dehydratase PrpD
MPIETCSVDKPKPINTGPSQAEGIAKFACRVKHADLTAERLLRLKVSFLDSLACAISSLGATPVEACLAQVKEFGSQGGASPRIFTKSSQDEVESK